MVSKAVPLDSKASRLPLSAFHARQDDGSAPLAPTSGGSVILGDEMVSERDVRKANLGLAFELAKEAIAAGLVVTELAALRPRLGEPRISVTARFSIQLWQPDGVMWAEGSGESAADVRTHIARWKARGRG